MSARSVCWRGSAVRLPPVSKRNMSSRRSWSFSTGSAFTRTAANSIASGMPSSRAQTCATAAALCGVNWKGEVECLEDRLPWLLAHPQHTGDRLWHQGRIRERSQFHQPDAVWIVVEELCRYL